MIIEPKHFEYLKIQRGEVSDALPDFQRWKLAYEQSLGNIFRSIVGSLPSECVALCDVGSGLGGIDILLAQHYGGDVAIGLVDGFNDPPEVVSHAATFNNMDVALDFHRKNGMKNTYGMEPLRDWHGDYDLFVSFAAYAFHIPPTTYLAKLLKHSHKGTKFIFDVRRTQKIYLEQLVEALGVPVVVEKGAKYVRCVFTRA